jgi:trans-2,3-dihydro-3-hydroxyanthranilate isomerase
MRYHFHTADVFTDRAFGGNQLAVFPDARGLDDRRMQLIAREFNYSETVFVFPPEAAENTRRLRIFTPLAELPFAGHPTLGTAHVLAAVGAIPLTGELTNIIFEEGVGPVRVAIRARDDVPQFVALTAAKLPEYGPRPPHPDAIAATLSLETSDLLLEGDAPQAISCGVPFLFVPVRDRHAIERARINSVHWESTLADFWARDVFVFTYETALPDSQVHARMFAPSMGIVEDPATGAAATALAGYLGGRDRTRDGTLRWVVEQGFEMGRPSLLEVEAMKARSEIVEIRVGGSSVLVSEGTMTVPDA